MGSHFLFIRPRSDMRADFRELCAEHGMNEAKSAQVKAALEIGRRLSLLPAETRYPIRTPQDAANLVMRASERPPAFFCARSS